MSLQDARQARPRRLVTVTRLDRLARSTFDLFGIVKRIVEAKAQFRSLAEPWADTGTSTGRLMLAVLGGLADVERDLIRTRTAEGRERAISASASRYIYGCIYVASPFIRFTSRQIRAKILSHRRRRV